VPQGRWVAEPFSEVEQCLQVEPRLEVVQHLEVELAQVEAEWQVEVELRLGPELQLGPEPPLWVGEFLVLEPLLDVEQRLGAAFHRELRRRSLRCGRRSSLCLAQNTHDLARSFRADRALGAVVREF
jgi:hypothetical protein